MRLKGMIHMSHRMGISRMMDVYGVVGVKYMDIQIYRDEADDKYKRYNH